MSRTTEYLYNKLRKLVAWLENRSGGTESKKNVTLTEDCGRGFKMKAINHKVNSCQTYIRHFGRFSILAKVFKTRISSFAVFPLEVSGNY